MKKFNVGQVMGWKGESTRHSLARRGVKTGKKPLHFLGLALLGGAGYVGYKMGKKKGKKHLHSEGEKSDYNGWSNHATWAVKLHWDNNQGDYDFFTGNAKEFLKEKKPLHEFADFLKEQYDEMFEGVVEGAATEPAKMMVRDVGNAHDVDWREIAQAYYDEEKENQEYEKKKNSKEV
jgi:hypothetical protein